MSAIMGKKGFALNLKKTGNRLIYPTIQVNSVIFFKYIPQFPEELVVGCGERISIDLVDGNPSVRKETEGPEFNGFGPA